MTKSTLVSDQGCVLDSGFGHVVAVIELRKKGTCSTNVIKKEEILAKTRKGPRNCE